MALAAAMCLCAAAGVEARSTLRPVTLESQALVQWVTRIAEAARQTRSVAVSPCRLKPARRAPACVGPALHDTHRPHTPPLLEALHNLPPPAHG